MKPGTPNPRPAQTAVKPSVKAPVGVTSPAGVVKHDAQGKGVLNWAAETARNIALSTSQVLRKLDHRGLSIDDTAPRGQPSTRGGQMPGGGMNPYENRPMARSGRGAKSTTVIKGAGATLSDDVGRGMTRQGAAARGAAVRGAKTRSPSSARARSSWWQRLFRRG